jgi:hypothetical protein
MSHEGAPPPPPPGQPGQPGQPGGPSGGYPGYGYQGPPPNHGSAVTSLVLGILSLVLCGFITGIPAMVMGRRVIREVRASNGTLGGEGLAQAGFWTGLVGTVLTCLSGLLVVGVFALGGTLSSTFEQTCSTVGPNGQSQSC